MTRYERCEIDLRILPPDHTNDETKTYCFAKTSCFGSDDVLRGDRIGRRATVTIQFHAFENRPSRLLRRRRSWVRM